MKKALFALLAIALLVLVACAPKETTPTEPAATTPTAPVDTTPTPTEPATPPDYSGLDMLSNVVCTGDAFTAVITNNNDEAWTINEDIKIILNGGWDQEPGCDTDVIEPGESTTCTAIDFPVVIKTRKNVIVVTGSGKTATEEVMCETAPVDTGSEDTGADEE